MSIVSWAGNHVLRVKQRLSHRLAFEMELATLVDRFKMTTVYLTQSSPQGSLDQDSEGQRKFCPLVKERSRKPVCGRIAFALSLSASPNKHPYPGNLVPAVFSRLLHHWPRGIGVQSSSADVVGIWRPSGRSVLALGSIYAYT